MNELVYCHKARISYDVDAENDVQKGVKSMKCGAY